MVFCRLGPDLIPEDRAIIRLFSDNKKTLFCASIGGFRKNLRSNLFFRSHLCKPVLRTHLLPGLLDPGGRQVTTDDG